MRRIPLNTRYTSSKKERTTRTKGTGRDRVRVTTDAQTWREQEVTSGRSLFSLAGSWHGRAFRTFVRSFSLPFRPGAALYCAIRQRQTMAESSSVWFYRLADASAEREFNIQGVSQFSARARSGNKWWYFRDNSLVYQFFAFLQKSIRQRWLFESNMNDWKRRALYKLKSRE